MCWRCLLHTTPASAVEQSCIPLLGQQARHEANELHRVVYAGIVSDLCMLVPAGPWSCKHMLRAGQGSRSMLRAGHQEHTLRAGHQEHMLRAGHQEHMLRERHWEHVKPADRPQSHPLWHTSSRLSKNAASAQTQAAPAASIAHIS